MIKKQVKNEQRIKRHGRIRTHLEGSPERPRLSVYRSNLYLYTQIIDDKSQTTLAQANTKEMQLGKNIEAAKKLGQKIAEVAKSKGITKVVFDRSGYLYHGRIKALAEAARENGLEF